MSCCSGCLFHEFSGVRLSTSAHHPDIKGSSSESDRWATLFNIHDVCPSKVQDEQREVCECVPLLQVSSPCKILGGGMRTHGIHLKIFYCPVWYFNILYSEILCWSRCFDSTFHHVHHVWFIYDNMFSLCGSLKLIWSQLPCQNAGYLCPSPPPTVMNVFRLILLSHKYDNE